MPRFEHGAMTALERILYLEDEEDIQAVVRLALEGLGGFTVRCCGSAKEALKIAPSFRPQLILLDVMLPEMDGPSTLKALRQLPNTRHTPVVFITARSQPGEMQQLRSLDVSDVLSKPFDPVDLPGTLRRIWRRIQLGSEPNLGK